jgi:hypothetical protein
VTCCRICGGHYRCRGGQPHEGHAQIVDRLNQVLKLVPVVWLGDVEAHREAVRPVTEER